MTTEPPNEDREKVEAYRRVVLQYEELDQTIDALLMENNGGTEDMSEADLQRYRELAHQRDELYNQLKFLESQLFANNHEDNTSDD